MQQLYLQFLKRYEQWVWINFNLQKFYQGIDKQSTTIIINIITIVVAISVVLTASVSCNMFIGIFLILVEIDFKVREINLYQLYKKEKIIVNMYSQKYGLGFISKKLYFYIFCEIARLQIQISAKKQGGFIQQQGKGGYCFCLFFICFYVYVPNSYRYRNINVRIGEGEANKCVSFILNYFYINVDIYIYLCFYTGKTRVFIHVFSILFLFLSQFKFFVKVFAQFLFLYLSQVLQTFFALL
eukprot:TRINITY_DN25974_c0_g1_i11.p3 TRINITY_DN25974_c0_g1~~TRINITY_DN25974_c0_g1_i11.p3  ORF type:complete len:241 (-),score=-1.98 TRINITY_DN25974_c0_g1_i11:833-1555(-)